MPERILNQVECDIQEAQPSATERTYADSFSSSSSTSLQPALVHGNIFLAIDHAPVFVDIGQISLATFKFGGTRVLVIDHVT